MLDLSQKESFVCYCQSCEGKDFWIPINSWSMFLNKMMSYWWSVRLVEKFLTVSMRCRGILSVYNSAKLAQLRCVKWFASAPIHIVRRIMWNLGIGRYRVQGCMSTGKTSDNDHTNFANSRQASHCIGTRWPTNEKLNALSVSWSSAWIAIWNLTSQWYTVESARMYATFAVVDSDRNKNRSTC